MGRRSAVRDVWDEAPTLAERLARPVFKAVVTVTHGLIPTDATLRALYRPARATRSKGRAAFTSR